MEGDSYLLRKTFLYKNSMLIFSSIMTVVLTFPMAAILNLIIATRSLDYNYILVLFLFAIFFISMMTSFQYIDIYPDKIDIRILSKVEQSFSFSEYYIKINTKSTGKQKKRTTLAIMRKSTKGRVFHTDLDISKRKLTELVAACEMIKK
jgi:hypothetical protein